MEKKYTVTIRLRNSNSTQIPACFGVELKGGFVIALSKGNRYWFNIQDVVEIIEEIVE